MNKPMNIQNWETKDGTRAFFVSRREIPIVDIEVVFIAGSAYDNKNYGISKLTNCMLGQETKLFNVDELAKKFEGLGVEFSVTSDRDIGKLKLRSLSNLKYLKPALQLFAEILAAPVFTENTFLRMQKSVLSAIEQQMQSPQTIAKKEFYAQVYRGHPYSHSVMGTTKSVRHITINDLKYFFSNFYVAQNAIVNIVGDIDRRNAESIVDMLVKHLSSGSVPAIIPQVSSINKEVKHVYFPSDQTHIVTGQVVVDINHPDYFPILVGNDILGGSVLTSRLYDVIREKHGLAYNILSTVSSLKAGGTFSITLQTRKTETELALNLTRNVINEFIAKGPTAKELISSKKKFINGFLFTMARNQDVLQFLSKISSFHLSPNYLEEYCDNINEVTITKAKDALQRNFSIDNMITITVGE